MGPEFTPRRGGLYLCLVSGKLLGGRHEAGERGGTPAAFDAMPVANAPLCNARRFEVKRPLRPLTAAIALAIFVRAVTLATIGVAPIAATALACAVRLILSRKPGGEMPLPKGLSPERAGVPFSILVQTLRRLERVVAPVEKREHRRTANDQISQRIAVEDL